ncbi:interleukin-3 receptor subunit alpha isoform X3 [Loxodonta africana]|uniref:interleukin-3 receptor subunit alpha-like isoform X3 n=1 Tax=Loxodonta africana TaxID=9785 RepID=UPI0030D30BEE
MSFVWLAVFLTPVGSLLERDPDPGAPISNIRVDPRRGRVVWDLNGSVAEVTCSTGSVYLSKADNTTTYCQFYAFLLCKTTNYTITVTSGPPFSTVIQYPKPEILAPPSLSGRCNKSYSLMEWNMSSHFIWDFIYELQIQKGTDPTHLNTPIVTDKNSHELVNPGTYVARIRARNNFGNTWSGWSPPRSFECDKDGSLGIWPATLSIALGTLLTILLVVLLCRRFSVIQKIFPPIPQMKDPVKDFFQNDRLVRGLLSSALGVSGDWGWCLPAQGRLWRGVSGGGCPVWMPGGDPGWPCPRLAKPGAQ